MEYLVKVDKFNEAVGKRTKELDNREEEVKLRELNVESIKAHYQEKEKDLVNREIAVADKYFTLTETIKRVKK